METFDWRSFLRQWSAEWLEDEETDLAAVPSDVIAARWLGYPGATEEQITRAEARLGTVLPPSYRAFLTVTNGWRWANFIAHLWPLEEIDWLSTHNQDFIDEWSKNAHPVPDHVYDVYGEDQIVEAVRAEYLRATLQISEWSDGALYLLNPRVVTPDGEWETWFYASWLPGARRYRSFRELMQAEYEDYREPRSNAAPS